MQRRRSEPHLIVLRRIDACVRVRQQHELFQRLGPQQRLRDAVPRVERPAPAGRSACARLTYAVAACGMLWEARSGEAAAEAILRGCLESSWAAAACPAIAAGGLFGSAAALSRLRRPLCDAAAAGQSRRKAP